MWGRDIHLNLASPHCISLSVKYTLKEVSQHCSEWMTAIKQMKIRHVWEAWVALLPGFREKGQRCSSEREAGSAVLGLSLTSYVFQEHPSKPHPRPFPEGPADHIVSLIKSFKGFLFLWQIPMSWTDILWDKDLHSPLNRHPMGQSLHSPTRNAVGSKRHRKPYVPCSVSGWTLINSVLQMEAASYTTAREDTNTVLWHSRPREFKCIKKSGEDYSFQALW